LDFSNETTELGFQTTSSTLYAKPGHKYDIYVQSKSGKKYNNDNNNIVENSSKFEI